MASITTRELSGTGVTISPNPLSNQQLDQNFINLNDELAQKLPLSGGTLTGALTVGGNLTVNGTTFTINSTTVTVDDPIFSLGGDTVPTTDDNKDRGIEFRWHNGSVAKLGFFGFDDSTGKFTFVPDATNTSEVFSGTKGTIDANIEWADVLSKPNYVASVATTSPLSGGAVGSVGGALTLSLAAGYGDTQNPYGSKTTSTFLAAPSAGNGAPSFRAIVASDIPTLNQNTTGTASNVTGTVAIANGGTGQTTQQAAINTLAGAVTSGQYLRGNGTNVTMSAIQAADVPTLNQSTTGNAATATTLQTARNINGVSFNGSADITVADSTKLPLAGGTLTGQLIIGASGTAGSPSLRINTSTSSTFVHTQENLAANLTAGQTAISLVGQAGSTKNSGYIGYYWAGAGSNSNYVSIGHWGADHLLRVYGDGGVTVGTNTVLHAGNYTTYSPTLTGTGASGTWSINITGNAGSATTAGKTSATTVPASTAFSKWLFATTSTSGTLDWNDSSNTIPGTGSTLLLGTATNGPGGSNYYHPFNIEYSGIDGLGNVTQMAVAYSSPGNELYMRGRYNGSWNGWNRFLNSSNYNSYSPTLTGTGASGTWSISITGNSTTTSQRSFSGDISTGGQGRFTGWYSGGAATTTAAEIGMSGGQGYIFVYNRDNSTYGTLNISASASNMQFSGGTINVSSGALQQGGNQVLHAGNYNSYSPTLTGTGASGTWSISVTGNAATATSASNIDGVAFNNSNSGNPVSAPDSLDSNGIGYVTSISLLGQTDGALYSQAYSSSWQHQIYGDYRTGQIAVRGKNSGTWQAWRTVLDSSNYSGYALPLSGGTVSGLTYFSANGQGVNGASTLRVNGDITTARGNGGAGVIYLGNSGSSYVYYDGANYFMPSGQLDVNGNRVLNAGNYNSYSPTLTGGNASGTWGINITGNSATVAGLAVHGGTNSEANKIVRTDGNGYANFGWINTVSGNSGVENRLTRIYSSYDGYLRYSTLTDFKVHMGLSAKNNHSRRIDYTTDSDYWVGSMGGSGIGANEAFHGGSGFIDIWSGTNFPSGRTHIMGFNALHYTTNSFGSTGGNAYGIQVVGQYDQGGELWSRGCSGGTFSSWRVQLDSSNYTNYAVSTTYNSSLNSDSRNSRGVTRLYRRDSDSDYSVQTYWTGTYWRLYGYNGDSGHADTHVGYADSAGSVSGGLTTSNYNSYSPTLTGGNASGTWGISITGNAATVSPDTNIRVKLLTFTGEGGDSGNGSVPTHYGIYQQGGSWVPAYPDLCIGFHTGIKIGAHYSYNGTRFYNNSDWVTEIFSVGNGDNNVRVANTLYSYAYRGNGNVGGTGEATYHPAGIYSTGTNWLYGTIYTNSYGIDANNALCNLNASKARRADGNFYIDDNYGCGIVGVYSSVRYQGVFAMGDSYKLPADGTSTGNLYGIAWSYPSAGGAAGNLDSHGMLVLINGGFGSAISYSIVASGNVTAYSDERLKTNWKPMPASYVSKLAGVKVGIYDRLDGEKITQVGVSAQSLQGVLPEAIITADDDIKTLSINYGGAALASAVELAKDNLELRSRIERLEALVEKLLTKE